MMTILIDKCHNAFNLWDTFENKEMWKGFLLGSKIPFYKSMKCKM